jgi:hypothetical protein
MTPLELSEGMLQAVASPTIITLMNLKVSFMLLKNIYSTGLTHDYHHLRSSYFYSTYHWCLCYKHIVIINDNRK